MSYTSPAAENILLIDDDFDPGPVEVDPETGAKFGKGLEKRDLNEDPIGGFAARFPLPLIPRSEWKDRIEQRDKDKATLRGKIERSGMRVKYQGTTNFCWANAVVFATQVVRMLKNGGKYDPVKDSLSPASIACMITGFRNVGGWGTQALKYIAQYGAVPTRLWGDNEINKARNNAETQKIRTDFQVLEWWDLKPRSFDEKMTCLFYGIPVACGYNWWRHEITAIDPAMKDGKFVTIEANSWNYTWGDNGYCMLMESKSTPDDATAPKVAE